MLLGRQSYVIRLRAEPMKPVDAYDILDPKTGDIIGVAWEEEPKSWARLFRAAWGRNVVPTAVHVSEQEKAAPTFSTRQASTVWSPRVNVTDAAGQLLGHFRGNFGTLGGGLTVFDERNRCVATIEGNTEGTVYRFIGRNGREIGSVSCESVARDLSRLPETEGYRVILNDVAGSSRTAGALLLAAALALDIVYRLKD